MRLFAGLRSCFFILAFRRDVLWDYCDCRCRHCRYLRFDTAAFRITPRSDATAAWGRGVWYDASKYLDLIIMMAMREVILPLPPGLHAADSLRRLARLIFTPHFAAGPTKNDAISTALVSYRSTRIMRIATFDDFGLPVAILCTALLRFHAAAIFPGQMPSFIRALRFDDARADLIFPARPSPFRGAPTRSLVMIISGLYLRTNVLLCHVFYLLFVFIFSSIYFAHMIGLLILFRRRSFSWCQDTFISRRKRYEMGGIIRSAFDASLDILEWTRTMPRIIGTNAHYLMAYHSSSWGDAPDLYDDIYAYAGWYSSLHIRYFGDRIWWLVISRRGDVAAATPPRLRAWAF